MRDLEQVGAEEGDVDEMKGTISAIAAHKAHFHTRQITMKRHHSVDQHGAGDCHAIGGGQTVGGLEQHDQEDRAESSSPLMRGM